MRSCDMENVLNKYLILVKRPAAMRAFFLAQIVVGLRGNSRTSAIRAINTSMWRATE